MAEPADFKSGAELNDTAVEAQAGPSARSAEEWLDSDGVLGAMQLPAIFTLSTAVIGLSTQCPTESVNECLLLVTKVTACDDDDDNDDDDESPTDAAEVLASEAIGQLLLRGTDITEPALHAAITNNQSYRELSICWHFAFVAIATKHVIILQICPIVHNLPFPKLTSGYMQ